MIWSPVPLGCKARRSPARARRSAACASRTSQSPGPSTCLRVRTMPSLSDPALAAAAAHVLSTGVGLAEPEVLAVLRLPDEELPAALELAHQVRMRWCGPEVEVEGIVSVKTGGCPEDC